MQLTRPLVPSQRYSPISDYSYENNHHEGVPSTRQPLRESTGNVQPHGLQPHSLASSALCYNQLSLSPPIHTIPTPPILPTQALTSTYGTSLRGERSLHRNVSLSELSMLNARGRKNPIYHHKSFADYRNKVMQKELDKEQPVWPDWLEDAFLDALLLIPQMGRKKFSSKAVLYGRNMLITEYLWIYHWNIHPPQKGERIPTGKQREKTKDNPGHPMFRSRKQVSSHIQVLKGFFPTLSTFHFIFPRQKDGLDDDGRLPREDEDTESFKNNRVLVSLADGHLPDERPNYEYFSRLLNAENDVFIRPKQCWIFVSSSEITLKEKHMQAEDGTLRKHITGFHRDGLCLSEADYPHLKLNEGKDYKDLPRQGKQSTVLLHEYTRNISQKESSSVKELASKWAIRFPEFKDKLTAALDDTRPFDENNSRCVVGPCDTFHFEVVLDLHATSKFPGGSDLNGLVEFQISRPDLHNHSWRSTTSVSKPEELYLTETETDFVGRSSPIDVIQSHRVGCVNTIPGRCDCTSRGSRDTISIPFPASSWANTFIKLAKHVTIEREARDRARAIREAGSLHGRAERDAARVKKEKEEASSHYKPKEIPSPKDLLSRVAMYQEIWSAPASEVAARNNSDESSSSKKPRINWQRRAVIMWTFVPVHENTDEKGKTTIVPAGCNWRFLTKVDPTSSYHQQKAYVSGGSPTAVSRNSLMSPDPGFSHHVNAAMHQNFSSTYENASTTSFTLPSHTPSLPHLQQLQTQQHLSGLSNVLDGFSNGLVTPPPTATLSSGYAHSFDGNTPTIDNGHTLHHHLSFMSDGTSVSNTTDNTSSNLLTSSGPDSTETFLTSLDVSDYMHEYATSPTQDLDMTARYMDTSAQLSDTGGVSWADTTNMTTSCSSESQWAAIAAAAAAAVGHTNPDLLSPHDESQEAWTPWSATELTRIPSNTTHASQNSNLSNNSYNRRPSIWDDGTSDGEPTFTLGSTGLTPLRNALQSQSQTPNLPLSMPLPLTMPHGFANTNTPSPALAGRKRSRTESVGLDVEDEEGCEGYPVTSIRKLAHHPASGHRSPVEEYNGENLGGGAPTAAMGGGGLF
ncbi:hypothetical protein GGR57DRAFT_513930 [Xylariaceae sp. FL1272]|nr:hypothetical protein GGR57DRAFT_513930 [Xylariaceae sp. FL1272]